MTHQIRRRDDIRPLASIPNKEGAVIVGVRKDGTEARLVVFVDKDGFYKVPGYADLTGWRLP
jgi:hypothetical protein